MNRSNIFVYRTAKTNVFFQIYFVVFTYTWNGKTVYPVKSACLAFFINCTIFLHCHWIPNPLGTEKHTVGISANIKFSLDAIEFVSSWWQRGAWRRGQEEGRE